MVGVSGHPPPVKGDQRVRGPAGRRGRHALRHRRRRPALLWIVLRGECNRNRGSHGALFHRGNIHSSSEEHRGKKAQLCVRPAPAAVIPRASAVSRPVSAVRPRLQVRAVNAQYPGTRHPQAGARGGELSPAAVAQAGESACGETRTD